MAKGGTLTWLGRQLWSRTAEGGSDKHRTYLVGMGVCAAGYRYRSQLERLALVARGLSRMPLVPTEARPIVNPG